MSCVRVSQAMSLGVLLALGCAKEPPLPPALPAERWAAYDETKGFPTPDQIHWPPKSVLEAERDERAAALQAAQRHAAEAQRQAQQREPRQAQSPRPGKPGTRGPASTARASIEQRYEYEPFKVYPVVSAPNHPTAILLPPGEQLAAPPVVNACTAQESTEADGDKGCWSVGETDMGPEGARQHVILVRPSKAGMDSTMPLLTQSGRTYFMRLRSQDALGMLAITWTPPLQAEPVLPVHAASAPRLGLAQVLPVAFRAPTISLDRLFTAYTIAVTSTQRPPWVPLQVFDDGSRTFIRFKEDLSFTASPAVFGVHADRSPAIVEFTPYNTPDGGLTYIVNGLHPLLVLSGVDRMEVTITRGAHAR